MKYNKHKQMDIGKQIYNGEMICQQAAEIFDVSLQTAKRYLKQYRNIYDLPPKHEKEKEYAPAVQIESPVNTLEDYECMTKEELIHELIRAKINEERAKKGYAVKGVGAQKEYILRSNRNTKS